MADPSNRTGGPQAATPGRTASAGSPTRGFLFADLRDYTRYLESHGAAEAADLLVRYRSIVRTSVARWDGAEIKTEGDSFYVVFPAVSAAVQCGLAIAQEAGQRTDKDGGGGAPIPVGIGIHAGETIETPDGFVGSAVNIAARICAIAKPGEVLVSDTVRALTQTVLPVSFSSRGRRTLKGVTEPVAVFAVAESDDAWATGAGRAGLRRRRWIAVGGIVGVLAIVIGSLAWVRLHPANALPPGPWIIGTDLPLTGDANGRGIPINNAVHMAIAETNATGGIGGAQLAVDERDDHDPQASANAAQNPDKGVVNVNALIGDPRVVAMIGPAGSGVAHAQIPLSNAAGLLQCSPSNTDPALTKPRDGALDLRSTSPTRINYIRTAPADDIQGPALASFVFRDLGAKRTLVIDDGDSGREIADQFSAAYQKLGGQVVRRALNPGADPATVLDPLAETDAPSAVFFGGFTGTGAPGLRTAMAAAGKAAIPFVSWDGIQDGSGADDGSFLQLAGSAAPGSYFSHAAIPLPKADFVERYRARYGSEPDEYSAAAYACAQVIIEALRSVATTGPSAAGLREAVRAYAVDPAHRYETVLGTGGFDANGDSLQQFVTFYRVDPSAAGGKGDWVISKQQDYGPAP
jgi:branched-chain amino acid transport system substrate-binding protein